MDFIVSVVAAIAAFLNRPLPSALTHPIAANDTAGRQSTAVSSSFTYINSSANSYANSYENSYANSHEKASSSHCPAKVLPYSSLRHLKAPMHSLHIESSRGGALYYFGVTHTNDPQHPQFDRLEQNFYQIQPSLVFYEGPGRSLPDTRDRAIAEAGDPGLIRYLATQHHIPIAQLEPSRQAEINKLLERFTPEQVKLFYVLRQVAELREVWNVTSDVELKQAVLQSIHQLSVFDGLKTVITDLTEFETSYKNYWQASIHWQDVPQKWFHPVLTPEETGGIFTNAIHRRASNFRNQYMVQTLSDAVNQGHRVMASVGRGHVPLQASALECLID